MRNILRIFSLLIFLAITGSAKAADAKDLFGALLGQIENQIQRKQQRQFRKRLRPLWQSCAKGNVDACDAAARFPLNRQDRVQLERMRTIAVQRPEFERNWHACKNLNADACRAALRYPVLNAQGRQTLNVWRQRAIASDRQTARQRTYLGLRFDCLTNDALRACNNALGYSNLDREERAKLTARRRQILDQKTQHEQANDAPRRALQALMQQCFSGRLSGCRDAISHSLATQTDRQRLIAKRDQIFTDTETRARRLSETRRARRLQADCMHQDNLASCRKLLGASALIAKDRSAIVRQFSQLVIRQERKEKAEAARQAEQQRFNQLHSNCLSDEVKTACVAAAEHRLASQSERSRFRRKEYELSSLPEQLVATFAKAASDGGLKAPTGLTPILVIALGIAGVGALVGYLVLLVKRMPIAGSDRPPEQRAKEPEFATAFASDFPLTGHLPTDVRQVLYGS